MLRVVTYFALVLLLAAAVNHPVLDPGGRLTSEAYVWQSVDRPEVRAALAGAADSFDCLHVLAAEAGWRDNQLEITRIPADTGMVNGDQIGMVLRLGQSTARLDWTATRVAVLAKVIGELAASQPMEIQIDYDCPARRLVDYNVLLDQLQAAIPGVPVVFTALPSWLDAPGFAALAIAHPNYILQVHALDLPADPNKPVVLCDPKAARRALGRAGKVGVPFRLALPTYGSEIFFDAGGRVVDVVSEDRPSPAVVRATSSQQVMADAPALAAFVAGLIRSHPRSLTGLVWYRLPVAGDQRNWPRQTLDRVRHGEAVAAHLTISLAANGNGSHDIILANTGNAPALLPAEIQLPDGSTAADGARPYLLSAAGTSLVRQPGARVWSWLQAGQVRTIGWIRHPSPPSLLSYRSL